MVGCSVRRLLVRGKGRMSEGGAVSRGGRLFIMVQPQGNRNTVDDTAIQAIVVGIGGGDECMESKREGFQGKVVPTGGWGSQ